MWNSERHLRSIQNRKRMKTLVLGDIHGRLHWYDIIQKEQPDRVIFLGDYVSTHDSIPADQQMSNLEDILNYKDENPDKVILMRGNHDTQHLGYYWAECSGWDPKVWQYMSESSFKERFLRLTQWVYVDEGLKVIFSHAGVSEVWLKETVEPIMLDKFGPQYDDGSIDLEVLLSLVNELEPSEAFGFIPDNYYDMCGTSKTQPPVWIRPEVLCQCNIVGYDQVVGHTPQRKIHKVVECTKGKQTIWLCDSLGSYNYLVIEDGEFIPKSL